jgi:hypothetical protein
MSIAEENGRNTGRTWTADGSQAGSMSINEVDEGSTPTTDSMEGSGAAQHPTLRSLPCA